MSEEHAHIVPYKTFAIVWIGLLILTAITIAVAQYDLGAMNVWVALGIATVKAGLVVAIFMHMKYEGKALVLSFLGTIFFLTIMISFTFWDVAFR